MAQHGRMTLVVGITAAEREAELIGDVIAEVAEDRPGLGIDIAVGEGGEAGEGREQPDVERRFRLGVEIIGADDPR